MYRAMLALIMMLITGLLASGMLVAVPDHSLVQAQINTETATETATETSTATVTGTATVTASATATATATASATATTTPTRPTISLPVEPYAVYLPVVRVSGTSPTPTQTASATLTRTPTGSPTSSPTASQTPTRTPTSTREPSPNVQAVNATGVYDGTDYYFLYGEVINSGVDPVLRSKS